MNHAGALRLEGKATEQIRFLRGAAPEKFYPAKARSEGIDGAVLVDLLINDAGQVQEALVLSESPLGEGFGLAALDAVKTYEFENSLKRAVLMTLLVQFLP